MDNFRIDVTSEGDIAPVMAIAFGRYNKAVGYAVRKRVEGVRWTDEERAKHPHLGQWKVKPLPLRLVLFWSAPESPSDFVRFPFLMDAAGAADFARRWLEQQDYGREPDHDGDNGKGWRVYCEAWGHVDGDWKAFIAIAPEWAMYGK